MKFQHPDIKRFLADSIPGRFAFLTPEEFESFMAHVFTLDGYEVESIPKKGDMAANLLAKKDGSSLVIRILRFPQEHVVQVDEVQKAIAAQAYYETDQSWIITTSSFSKEAQKAANAADIESWDWEALYQALSDLFFEGKNHLEYADTVFTRTGIDTPSDLKLKVKWMPEEGISSEWYNLDLTIANPTNRNIFIHLDLPALIDGKKNQITAEKWAENEFVAGMLYEGASVRTNALFKASRIGERPTGGRVMLTCHERTDPPSTYHLSARLKGEACYFVTYCYSRYSAEYFAMINYRDTVVSKTLFGKCFIYIYYSISPFLVRYALRNKLIDKVIRSMTAVAIRKLQKQKK